MTYWLGLIRPRENPEQAAGSTWPFYEKTELSRLFSQLSQIPIRSLTKSGRIARTNGTLTYREFASNRVINGRLATFEAEPGLHWAIVTATDHELAVVYILSEESEYLCHSVECYVFYKKMMPFRLLFVGSFDIPNPIEVHETKAGIRFTSVIGEIFFQENTVSKPTKAHIEYINNFPLDYRMAQTSCVSCHHSLPGLKSVPNVSIIRTDTMVYYPEEGAGASDVNQMEVLLYHWKPMFSDGTVSELNLKFAAIHQPEINRDAVIATEATEISQKTVIGWNRIVAFDLSTSLVDANVVVISYKGSDAITFP